MTKALKVQDFLRKAKELHGDKYDYSKIEYKNNTEKVCIICPIHGEFWQTPKNHLRGHGCTKCGRDVCASKTKKSFEEFVGQANNVHQSFYTYPKQEYKNAYTSIEIICPKHGLFKQVPHDHLKGHGCPKCMAEKVSKINKMNTEEFISRAKEIHNGYYFYNKTDLDNKDDNGKVVVTCPVHGDFYQTPHSHMRGHGCPLCANISSQAENEIFEYVKSLESLTIQRDRTIISPLELDMYIPDKKIAIEYNGLYWHCSMNKDKHYHIRKTEECKKKGIKLIQIFEDEYAEHKDIVLNKIKHLLKHSDELPKIMGRKCVIKVLSHKDCKEFLDTYHIQGCGSATIYLGAFYNDALIGVMSFRSEYKGSDRWELTRFASDYHYICQGIGGKLFNYFVKNYKPSYIKSFADRRWTINENSNVYLNLGFRFDGYTTPTYSYYFNLKRYHKFNFRKNILSKKYNLPMSMTETEMVDKIGAYRIYDCGLIRYIWNNKNIKI
jgi:very-short-patch-repair endonuclease